MFGKKGRGIAFALAVVFVTALLIGGIVQIQRSADAHNENQSPRHTHSETIERWWGYCGSFSSVARYHNGWWYRKTCWIYMYEEVRYQTHGVDPPPPPMTCKCTPNGPDYCPCDRCYEYNCNYQN